MGAKPYFKQCKINKQLRNWENLTIQKKKSLDNHHNFVCIPHVLASIINAI